MNFYLFLLRYFIFELLISFSDPKNMKLPLSLRKDHIKSQIQGVTVRNFHFFVSNFVFWS